MSNPVPLMPHQEEAVQWLLKNRRGLLAHEPGCGKTLSALETVRRDGCRRVLIVAPSPLLSVWRDEAIKWYGWTVDLVRLPPKDRQAYWLNLATVVPQEGHVNLTVVSYETLRIDFPMIRTLSWDAVVFDETLKIQNPTAKVTKAAMTLKAPLKIALNGTPISNSWADLWPVMTWLEPLSLYGNFYKFRAIHAIMNPHFPAIVGWRDTETIKTRTAPLTHAKRKTDVLQDLPEMTEQTISFDLSEMERRFYKTIKEELQLSIGGQDVPISNALVELLRLRQTANGLFAFNNGDTMSSKIDALEDLLADVPKDAKVLVFTSFKESAKELKRRFPHAQLVTGETDARKRETEIDTFKKTGSILIGTDAIAYGVNLQEASYVVNFDLPWSYAKYEQRIGRAWRKGQKNAVTVYNLEANGTVDAHVRKILERKMKNADEVMSVTRDDLRAILDM